MIDLRPAKRKENPAQEIETQERPEPHMTLPESEKQEEVPEQKEESTTAPVKGKKGKGKSSGDEKDIEKLCNQFSDTFKVRSTIITLGTGSVSFDYIFGGGLPRGRIIELHSDSGLGKTTIVLSWAFTICSSGGFVVVFDAEKALNDSLIEGIGLWPFYNKTFFVWKIDTFKQFEDATFALLRSSRSPDLIVLDSITSLMTQKMLDNEISCEDSLPGWHARSTSDALRKCKAWFATYSSCLVLVNQKRTKLDFRNPSQTRVGAAGGTTLEFYPDIRVDITKAGFIEITEDGDKKKIGVDLYAECVKNKMMMPFISTIVSVFFGRGISNTRSMSYLLEAAGVVRSSGAYYYVDMNGLTATCQGRSKFEEWILSNDVAVREFLKSQGKIF